MRSARSNRSSPLPWSKGGLSPWLRCIPNESCVLKRFGGAYVLEASDNQPTLAEASADLFADRTPDRQRWRQAETWV